MSTKDGYSPVSPRFPPHSFANEQAKNPFDDHHTTVAATSSNAGPTTTTFTGSAYPPAPALQATYPPTSFDTHSQASLMTTTPGESIRRVQLQDAHYDPERAQPPSLSMSMPSPGSGSEKSPGSAPGMPMPERPGNRRNTSWDLLNQMKQNLNAYEEFDTRNASEAHLAFAEGDVPKNKVSKLYHYFLNVSIVTRWIIFIIPVLALLWIPGIVGLTGHPNAGIWNVKLIWWSIWLSVVWVGWWAALALSRILPTVIRWTLGVVAVGTRKYIDWLGALQRYVALTAWTLAIWITFNVLITRAQPSDSTGERSKKAVELIAKLLFGFFLCSAVLLFEKFAIQWIAGKFHERSYAERIADQKFAVRSLVTLYRQSSDIPGRSDTLHAPSKSATPKFFKKALKGFRAAATTTTTAFGNVASEIAGSSVLQPNSPQAVIKVTLESANKSRMLARRIFYSFAKHGSEYLYLHDIARFFSSPEEASRVFAIFDKDDNGDVSREEVELACVELHREQLSIEHSMQDLDSAVGRLDNIFMSVYVIIAALIIAVCLEAQLVTLITGAGTLILGLSWLIGASLQEVLTSIIFLFIKHPFDVGDRIVLDKGGQFTVKEIRLLSTVLVDGSGCTVQAPNMSLNTMFIHNIRRSGLMTETFTFEVDYKTSFTDLERLRDKMIQFLENQRRDFIPDFDVNVVDFPGQEKMILSADINYKSNIQSSALKTRRRNKWICALKNKLAEVRIFGPNGDPGAPTGPKQYTQVPWEEYKQMKATPTMPSTPSPADGWRLSRNNASMRDDADHVFGDDQEPRPRLDERSVLPAAPGPGSSATLRSRGAPPPVAIAMPTEPSGSGSPEDAYEMTER